MADLEVAHGRRHILRWAVGNAGRRGDPKGGKTSGKGSLRARKPVSLCGRRCTISARGSTGLDQQTKQWPLDFLKRGGPKCSCLCLPGGKSLGKCGSRRNAITARASRVKRGPLLGFALAQFRDSSGVRAILLVRIAASRHTQELSLTAVAKPPSTARL